MVQAHRHHQMQTAPVGALLWQMTLPLLPAIALMLLTDLLESFLMARHSTTAITALGFSSPVITIMFSVAIALSICTNRHICQVRSFNQGGEFSGAKIGLLLGAGIGLFLTVVTWILLDPLLQLLGISKTTGMHISGLLPGQTINSLTTEYTQIRLLAWVPLILIWQCNGILRSLGLMRRAGILIVLWAGVKASYFIWTMCWQNPDLSSLLSQTATIHASVDTFFAFLSGLVLWHGLGFTLIKRASQGALLSSQTVNENTSLIKNGKEALVVLLQQSLTPISIAVLTALAGQLAASDVALISMTYRIEAMSLIIPMTLTASLPGLLACNWWSDHRARVRKLLTTAFAAGASLQLLIAVLLVLFHSQVSAWLTQDMYMQQSLHTYLIWVPISFIGAGSTMVAISLLNIIGKAGYATMLGIMHRLVLIIPLAATGAIFWGIDGIFMALLVGHSLALVLAIYWCHSVGLIRFSVIGLTLRTKNDEQLESEQTHNWGRGS